jgi:hypothetical protein
MFFDELIGPENFYQKLGTDFRSTLRVGQLCRTAILYCYENREVWRPDRYDRTHTRIDAFKIGAAGGDAFRRSDPLVIPALETNEEFPVVRAKRRPVVILRPAPPGIEASVAQSRSQAIRPQALVAPLYSVQLARTGELKFARAFIDRVRVLEWPEYFFMPTCSVLECDSLLALPRITNAFEAHLEPFQWTLSDQVVNVLLDQLRFYLDHIYEGVYADAREMLLHPEAAE